MIRWILWITACLAVSACTSTPDREVIGGVRLGSRVADLKFPDCPLQTDAGVTVACKKVAKQSEAYSLIFVMYPRDPGSNRSMPYTLALHATGGVISSVTLNPDSKSYADLKRFALASYGPPDVTTRTPRTDLSDGRLFASERMIWTGKSVQLVLTEHSGHAGRPRLFYVHLPSTLTRRNDSATLPQTSPDWKLEPKNLLGTQIGQPSARFEWPPCPAEQVASAQTCLERTRETTSQTSLKLQNTAAYGAPFSAFPGKEAPSEGAAIGVVNGVAAYLVAPIGEDAYDESKAALLKSYGPPAAVAFIPEPFGGEHEMLVWSGKTLQMTLTELDENLNRPALLVQGIENAKGIHAQGLLSAYSGPAAR